MKPILLACSFMLLSYTSAFCAIDIASFTSNINRFEAGMSRSNTKLYEKAYIDVLAALNADIAENKLSVKNMAGNDKKALETKIKDEETLYKDVETLGADKQKNSKEIVSKLRKFAGTLQTL